MKPALFASLLFAAVAMADEPLTIAVLDFQSTDEGLRDLGPKLATLVSANLSTKPELITVERSELDRALGEQELGLSGVIVGASAARVGQLTGAKILVTGRIMKAGNETLVVSKVIGTETTRVFGNTTKLDAAGSLFETSAAVSAAISEIATKNAAVLLGPAEDRKSRIARIKGTLPAGKLPVVSVHIPEQHFGHPAVDPAAETELLLVLQECGFPIADEKSANRADFAIEGEAFSERAMQKGNLISCQARVEVKLRKLASGELLSADRETSVAVELSEHIAGKSALQKAAFALAERLAARVAR